MSMWTIKLPQPTAAGAVTGRVDRTTIPIPLASQHPPNAFDRPAVIVAGQWAGDPNHKTGTRLDFHQDAMIGLVIVRRLAPQAGYAILDFRRPLVYRRPFPWFQDGPLASLASGDELPDPVAHAMAPADFYGELMQPAGPIDTRGD